MSDEDDVRKASQQFYAALTDMANGDSDAMAGVWAQDETVTALHPIGGRDIGWDAVGGSFGKVAQLASAGKVELTDQVIRVVGDAAWEIGNERGQLTLGGHKAVLDHRVTNIYRRQGGTWKMIHHHADVSPALLEVLGRLQKG